MWDTFFGSRNSIIATLVAMTAALVVTFPQIFYVNIAFNENLAAGMTYSASVPAPTNLSASCSGSSATLSWSLPAGYDHVLLRLWDMTQYPKGGGTCLPSGGVLCRNDYEGTSSSQMTTPGHAYQWWLHILDPSTGQYGNAALKNFSCPQE